MKILPRDLLMIAISAFAMAASAASEAPSPVCASARCAAPAVLDSFTPSITYEDTPTRFRARYAREDHIARADIQTEVSKAQAQHKIALQIHALRGLYDRRLSPYPGELSNEIACPEAERPNFAEAQFNGPPLHYMRGKATARLTFGACADDLTAYEGLIAWYWCPQPAALIQLELMVPKDDPAAENILLNDLRGLQCPTLTQKHPAPSPEQFQGLPNQAQ